MPPSCTPLYFPSLVFLLHVIMRKTFSSLKSHSNSPLLGLACLLFCLILTPYPYPYLLAPMNLQFDHWFTGVIVYAERSCLPTAKKETTPNKIIDFGEELSYQVGSHDHENCKWRLYSLAVDAYSL